MKDEDEAYVRELIAAELAKERAQQQGENPSMFGGSVLSCDNKNESSNGAITTTTCTGGNGACNSDDDELRGIREWINSLPDDGIELLRSMEFDVLCDVLCPDLAYADGSGARGGTSSLGSGSGPGGAGASATCDATSTDPGSDVLLQLLQLQAPPPTPIHPRAVSYKSASCAVSGATDGRDEEKRVLAERFRRPRLFQLVERMSSGKRNGRGKRQQQQSQTQTHSDSEKRYDVIARKFITASGDVLSIGCTDRQQRTDELFLSDTMVTHYFNDLIGGGDAAMQGIRRRCHLRLSDDLSLAMSAEDTRKERIMRVLTIVSRGRFLSTHPRKGTSVEDKYPFCAPWLEPASEWFSLPMFLASRFEASLWHAFDQLKTKGMIVSPYLSCSDPLDGILSTYSHVDASRLVSIAIGGAFSKLLHQEGTLSGLVRDGLVWRLINEENPSIVPSGPSNGYGVVKSLLSLRLIQMGSSLDKYRYLALSCLKDCLAAEAEKRLLSEMAAEEEKKTDNPFTVPNASARSRRSKKKRKKGRKSRSTPVLKRIDETSPAQEESSVNTNNTAAPEDDAVLLLARRSNSPSLPSVGANQNTIMVLQILDDIVCSVFEEVGLGANEDDEPHESFSGVGEKRETKPQKQSISFQYKKPRRNLAHRSTSATASVGLQSVPTNHQEWSHNPRATTPIGSHIRNNRPQSPDSSSISMLSYNTNPYHHPQSPHEHVFSFMDSSHSNLSNRPTAGGFHGYGSIFDDGSSPLGMALNLGTNIESDFNGSGHIGGRWQQYPSRDRSLFAEFFDREDTREAQDVDEMLMAASTAASFASSNAYDDASSSNAGYDNDDDVDDDDSEGSQNMFEEDYKGIGDNDRRPTNLSAVSLNASSVGEEDVDMDLVASQATAHGGNIKEPGDELDRDEGDGEKKKSSISVGSTRGKDSVSIEEIHLPKRETPPLLHPDLVPGAPQTLTVEEQQRVETPSQDNTSTQRDLPLTPSEPPPTPPPQLSPIQVSLADLGKFIKASKRSDDVSRDFEKATSVSSLPGSPRLDSTKRNWSRDDLTRLASMNDVDDAAIGMRRRRRVRSSSSQNFEEVMSYRTALSKSIKGSSTCSRHEVRSVAGSVDHRFLDTSRRQLLHTQSYSRLSIPDVKKVDVVDGHSLHTNLCARSETALDAFEDSSHVNVMRPHEEMDNATTTRDGATTISSAATPGEPQEVSNLREERDAFRDLCLTLGAEVAKLKSTVASLQQGQNSSMAYTHPQMGYASTTAPHQPYFYSTAASGFAPEGFPPGYAMSDAGVGHDTTRSEDGSDAFYQGDAPGLQTQWQGDQGHPTGFIQIRRPSLGCNRTVSTVDHDAGCHGSIAMSALRSSVHRDTFGGGVLSQGLQSRLSIDINSYCASISSQLKKQENRRITATKRLTRLVTTLWPRAQVKLYGSHVTDLCLPSSDLDFVVCLPSVHKEKFATTPGVLEGQNAINESNQKVLARKLKGESWIDPRSIKVIERTAIPVIKVSTKDKRSRVIQLDISFDSPNHHGLEAIDLVTDTIQEYPVCRPLMLVLKQFLLDRGLLTAYTGGLSSYGLFLMLSRYLQEQNIGSWTDCGSLLIGFLDFYGNNFDPRQVGVSARNRQFFSRPYHSQQPQQFESQPIWNASPSVVSQIGAEGGGFPDLNRRHSFAETVPRNAIGNVKSGTAGPRSVAPASGSTVTTASTALKSPIKHNPPKPPRIQTKRSSSHLSLHNEYPVTSHSPKILEPLLHRLQGQVPLPYTTVPPSAPIYTFDPLMCEDPLNPTNNIGRNTFRIFQVLRAFSDAHRALIASLEWDMNDLDDENDFPLLKSLLQNEDIFFESESHLSAQPN